MEDGRSLYGRYQVYMDATQETFFNAWNTKVYFLILLNSVSKRPLGRGVKGPLAYDMPRAPRNVNPALDADKGKRSLRAENSLVEKRLKAGFPLANLFARSDFFFCLYPINSTWFQLRNQRQMKNSLRIKVQTHRTRIDNATRFFSFWKLIKQPMRANFERYVDQITQNVITLLNIWKI
jgi:hypothetical protein